MNVRFPRRRIQRCMIAGLCLAIAAVSLLLLLLNDRYAFVKSSHAVELEITQTDTPITAGQKLKHAGVIAFPRLFARQVRAPLQAGTYTVSKNLSYDALASLLCGKKKTNAIVRLTFTEGETVPEIVEKLTESGIGSQARFYEVINHYDFDFAYLPKKAPQSGFRLEGYLYPDTYEFYQNSTEETVIARFLRNFEKKFDRDYLAQCQKRGWSVADVVTLASMIQAEAGSASDYAKVSSVFHNRLASDSFPYLESDATVRYALRLQGQTRAVTPNDLKIDSPYNTYLRKGLPQTAVCNPGKEALAYALCPAKTSYYYFVSNAQKETRFARTYAEHQRNIDAFRKNSEKK